jgi:hypothetical protein
VSPTGRTLDLLRRSGYLAAVVETWVPRVNRRRDLFRFADVLGVHPVRREVILVQTTTAGHVAHRLAKIKAIPELAAILASGCKVSVHGWDKRAGQWHCRIVDVLSGDLDVIAADLPRRGRRWKQPSLFTGPSGS